MPQRYEPKRDKVDIEVNVDYGPKACIATAAKTSPIKYSMAFRSKAPVGMQLPQSTSAPHAGPGLPDPRPGGIVIKNPTTPSIAFMAQHKVDKTKGGGVGEDEDAPLIEQHFQSFSDTHKSGPVFSKAGTGAGLVMKHKVERQLKTIYPRLSAKLFPVPVVVHVDPWAHLKPKKK